MTLLEHIPTEMKRVASTRGGEWHGPCPFCGGRDRFRVQPARDFYRCRVCGRSGDSIQFRRDYNGDSFADACRAVGRQPDRTPTKSTVSMPAATAPPKRWQEQARRHVDRFIDALWSPRGARALAYLRGRGFTDQTIGSAAFGYNARDVYEQPADWGIDGGKKIFLPRGITIPWGIGDDLWDIRVRRPLPKGSDKPRYMSPRGRANGLYLSDFITTDFPVLLVEGELDAWSAAQEAGDLIMPVASGSTTGARRLRWSCRLALASVVLVAYDSDDAGEDAARHWLAALPGARRWRPYWGDVNAMLQDGADVRGWIGAGLNTAPTTVA